jgi:hypothetical protein
MFTVLRPLARRLCSVVAECHYAQWRLTVLRISGDSYLFQPQEGPDTYDAFMYRTWGLLPHEPSAAERAAGRLVH